MCEIEVWHIHVYSLLQKILHVEYVKIWISAYKLPTFLFSNSIPTVFSSAGLLLSFIIYSS